jgi:hypothetical protein
VSHSVYLEKKKLILKYDYLQSKGSLGILHQLFISELLSLALREVFNTVANSYYRISSITRHNGFTLWDLDFYNKKYHEAHLNNNQNV